VPLTSNNYKIRKYWECYPSISAKTCNDSALTIHLEVSHFHDEGKAIITSFLHHGHVSLFCKLNQIILRLLLSRQAAGKSCLEVCKGGGPMVTERPIR